MSLRRLSTTALALCLTAAVASTAQAQATCSASGTGACNTSGATSVAGTMPRIAFLSVTNPVYTTLTIPSEAAFDAGGGIATGVNAGAQTATVRSNVAWTLSVIGAAVWTGGAGTKVVGDLEWTIDAGSTYNTMATSGGTIAGPLTAASNGAAFVIGYRTTWRLATDAPATYTMPLTFTLTAP